MPPSNNVAALIVILALQMTSECALDTSPYVMQVLVLVVRGVACVHRNEQSGPAYQNQWIDVEAAKST